MSKDLASLGVDELVRLGALKNRCSVPLRCVAHGLNLPCELCELEGKQDGVCTACGQLYTVPPAVTTNRPCSSIAQFHARGVIAFPDAARGEMEKVARPSSTLEAELRRATAVAEETVRKLKEAEAKRREAAALKPGATDKGRSPKVEPAKPTSPEPIKAAKAEAERPAPERALAVEVWGERYAGLATLASFLAALAGLKLVYAALLTLPSLQSLNIPSSYLSYYLVFGFLTWYIATRPLTASKTSYGTLRWWAPAVWALVSFSMPGSAALVASITIHHLFNVGWDLLVWLVAGPAIWLFCNYFMAYLATGLTMRAPWPSGIKDQLMPATPALWLGLILTMLLNITIIQFGSLGFGGKGAPTILSSVKLPEPSAIDPSTSKEGKTPAQTSPKIAPITSEPKRSNPPLREKTEDHASNHYPAATDRRPPATSAPPPSARFDASSDRLAPPATPTPLVQEGRTATHPLPIPETWVNHIRQSWVRPLGSGSDLSCIVRARFWQGQVVDNSVRIFKSSGDPAFDRSVIAALYKASPLPVSATSSDEQFSDIQLIFKAD